MNPATVTTVLGALVAAGTGCAATVRVVRGEPTDRDPTTDRYEGDTAWTRGLSFGLALTGSTALLMVAVTSPAALGTCLLWALLAVVCLVGWLILGGRIGYDAGASVICRGALRPAHRVPRGTSMTTRQPEGDQVCADCVQAQAAADETALRAEFL
jgi:hypothetical protein